MTLRARILTEFDILLSGSADLGSPSVPIAQAFRQAYDTGTGANEAQIAFGDIRTVSGSATDSIDLAGGLTGLLGGTLTFTAIKEIFIFAAADNPGNLQVGEQISNAFVGPFQASAVGNLIVPGGIFHVRNPSAAGWTVTAGTGDLLPVKNLSGSSASFTIILIGEGS